MEHNYFMSLVLHTDDGIAYMAIHFKSSTSITCLNDLNGILEKIKKERGATHVVPLFWRPFEEPESEPGGERG